MTGRFSEAIRPNFGWPSAQPFEHLALLCKAWKNVTSWTLKLSRPLCMEALMTCLMISFSSRSIYSTTSGLGLRGLIGRLSFCSVLEERPFSRLGLWTLAETFFRATECGVLSFPFCPCLLLLLLMLLATFTVATTGCFLLVIGLPRGQNGCPLNKPRPRVELKWWLV